MIPIIPAQTSDDNQYSSTTGTESLGTKITKLATGTNSQQRTTKVENLNLNKQYDTVDNNNNSLPLLIMNKVFIQIGKQHIEIKQDFSVIEMIRHITVGIDLSTTIFLFLVFLFEIILKPII